MGRIIHKKAEKDKEKNKKQNKNETTNSKNDGYTYLSKAFNPYRSVMTVRSQTNKVPRNRITKFIIIF